MKDFALTSPVPVGGRRDGDHYPTPRWCVEALIDRISPWPLGLYRSVLDPSCGEGAILDVFREVRGARTMGYEIDPARAEAARQRGHQVEVGDALDRTWAPAEVCVMNPPYSRAEEFVRKAIRWRYKAPHDGGDIFALLRLSFLEPTRTRRDLLDSYSPDVLILPRRPAFDGRGTDSITSAWFCWPGSRRLTWLPDLRAERDREAKSAAEQAVLEP